MARSEKTATTKAPQEGSGPVELTEIKVRPEQARYLADLNTQAVAVAEAANEKFQVALSAVLMGQVHDGSEIVKIDSEKGVLYVKEGVAIS